MQPSQIHGSQLIRLVKETLREASCEVDIESLGHIRAIQQRKQGKRFALAEHVEGLVFSLLSNQRSWKGISDNEDNIKEIFFGFDPDQVMARDGQYFVQELQKIQCGNRAIHKQMDALRYNIDVLKNIEQREESLDAFVTSDSPENIVAKLTEDGPYRLKQVGMALGLEYLRNVGIDAIKPDVHICRILGKDRLGFSQRAKATEDEAILFMKRIAEEANLSLSEVDSWLWHLCAKGYGNICGETSQCFKCKLQDSCAHPKKADGQMTAPRVDVKVSTGPYCLVASGSLLTIDNMPVVMTVSIGGQQTVNVEVQFHDDFHPEGLSLVRSKSECSAVERWDIYQSNDGVCCRTTKPVPIMVYQSGLGARKVCLQLGAQPVAANTYRVEYAWFAIDGDMLNPTIN